jgi:FAD/FMN-containing dehydrogenase
MIRAKSVRAGNADLEDKAVADLAADLRGELIGPDDSGYDDARQVFNAMIDRRPALVARPADVSDVARTVRFARRHKLLTAVRGGGHSVAGNSTCDGCLVLDLSAMNEVRVDPESGMVRAGGGATLGDVDAVTQAYGLAVPLGIVSLTGIAGLTLGGGIGWLMSKYGLTVDNLTSAEVVTPDGEVVTASETENADLLWGLRGGGGNFGIVTEFTYQAHAVGPEVFFTVVLYPADHTRDALQLYRDFNKHAPDEATAFAALGMIPEGAEKFPEEIRGLHFVGFKGMYAGPVEEGERVMEPLRRLSEPLVDGSRPLAYVQAQQIGDARLPPGELRHYWKSANLMELSDAAIDRIVDYHQRQPSQKNRITLVPVRGAVARVEDDDTAFHGRKVDSQVLITADWKAPADDEANVAWARGVAADLKAFSDGSRYLNFSADEDEAGLRAAFGPGYERLAQLKRKYDPTNFLRLNQNIEPASSQSSGRRDRIRAGVASDG